MEWRSPRGSARTRCRPPVPSCLGMKVRGLVVYDSNRDGSGPGKSGYLSKPAPFGPGMDYTYWTVDVYGDTRINPHGDGGGDGLTLTPAPYPPRSVPAPPRSVPVTR